MASFHSLTLPLISLAPLDTLSVRADYTKSILQCAPAPPLTFSAHSPPDSPVNLTTSSLSKSSQIVQTWARAPERKWLKSALSDDLSHLQLLPAALSPFILAALHLIPGLHSWPQQIILCISLLRSIASNPSTLLPPRLLSPALTRSLKMFKDLSVKKNPVALSSILPLLLLLTSLTLV